MSLTIFVHYLIIDFDVSICFVGGGPTRFEGDRPRFGDRDGYRGGPRGPLGEFGDKGGAPAEYQPSFRVISLSFILFTII